MRLSRDRVRVLCVALAILLVVGALVSIALWERRHLDFSSDSEWEMAEFVEYEGEYYRIRDDVDTFLVIGVDKFSTTAREDSYNNDQCADFLLLMAIDHAAKRCSVVQINRDTMAEVTLLGIGGKKLGKVTQQITLSHTYGTGAQDSCRNTARAVSDLFGGLGVDRFVCLTMDAVACLNDLVGGVTVTVQEDLTAIDPAFVQGAQITLESEQALRYVRHRAELEDSSNAARMERQEQYLTALYHALLDRKESNETFPTDTVAALSSYMTSDCSVNELERLVEQLSTYERGEIYQIGGEYAQGEYMEFYPDDAELQRLVIELFYQKK